MVVSVSHILMFYLICASWKGLSLTYLKGFYGTLKRIDCTLKRSNIRFECTLKRSSISFISFD